MSLRSIGVLGCVMVLSGMCCAGAQVAGSQTAPDAAAAVANGTRVHGTITDPDGELIPGATITLTPAKGGAKKAVSGSDGTYTLVIAPGSYTYLVTMPGFASYSAMNVKIPAVAGMTLDAKLKIGESTEVVNVDANAIALSVDPDSNASSTILTGKDLEALSDDPDELSSELQALAGPSAGPNGGQIYVDGFTGGQLPPKSSIREIRINQNPFSAQYDRLGFGRIEVFTKPGTDKIHGSLQVNGNPSQFNSPNPIETAAGIYIPPYHTVFLFGSLTGPINKKASYSVGGSYRDIEDDSFTNATILGLTTTSTTPCGPGAASAGCVQANALLSTHSPQTRYDISPRIDLALGDKNVLTTRFQFVKNDETNQGIGGTALPGSGSGITSNNVEIQMSDTQTFSSKLINETRFEYERDRSTTTPVSLTPSVGVSGSFSTGSGALGASSDHQDHIEVQNYTSIQLKKNFLRLGGRLRTTREADNVQSGTAGSFTYTSLSNYAAGTPGQFRITQVHIPTYSATLADLGLYAETDWKARQNLTISYGIRYETQNNLNDHHDFAPRVSASYGLGSGKSAPKTVLRGGFGMFYDRFGQGQVMTLARQGQGKNIETVYTESGAAIPVTCTPSATATCVTGATATASNTTYSTNHNLRTPYTIQAALGVDRQLGRVGTVSFNYVHSQGVHQLATQNATYGLGTTALDYEYFSEGVFAQNQLTVNGRVQVGKKISLFGYYALGSAKGDTSGAGAFLSTPGNLAADYGRTAFDVRQRIFMGGSVTLPQKILFSPFLIGQSGNPYNVTTGADTNLDTQYNDRPIYGAANGIPAGQKGSNTIAGCGSFVAPAPGSTYKAIPINACTGPALFTFNFRLTKTFGFGPSTAANAAPQGGDSGRQRGGPPGGGPGGGGGSRGGGGGGPQMFGGGGASTGKRYNLTVGLMAQNLFNDENLASPVAVLSSPQFGQSTQLTGGAYTSNSALRRIALQASFTF
jgi:hypothetical protein